MSDIAAAANRYRRYLETLSPETLDRLPDHVTPDVRFRDPFNDVRGAGAMRRVFDHMFETVGSVRFDVRHLAADGEACLMVWRFEASLRGAPWAFDGMSVVRFAPDGRVAEHIDYWDPAAALYERLPLIGRPLAWLRRRLAARSAPTQRCPAWRKTA